MTVPEDCGLRFQLIALRQVFERALGTNAAMALQLMLRRYK